MDTLWRIMVAAFGVSLVMSFASADPNTTFKSNNCYNNPIQDTNYANSVAYVLDDMTTVTANHPGYDYLTHSPYPTVVAFGHSTCNRALVAADCVTCVSAVKDLIKQMCPNKMGAEVNLQDCSMKYGPTLVNNLIA